MLWFFLCNVKKSSVNSKSVKHAPFILPKGFTSLLWFLTYFCAHTMSQCDYLFPSWNYHERLFTTSKQRRMITFCKMGCVLMSYFCLMDLSIKRKIVQQRLKHLWSWKLRLNSKKHTIAMISSMKIFKELYSLVNCWLIMCCGCIKNKPGWKKAGFEY